MTEVRLLPEAEDDLAEAAAFLSRQVSGLGNRLVIQVEEALGRLNENPHVGPKRRGEIRKLRVRRFPYNLIYRILSDHVLVIAVAHHRRRPSYWQDRS